MLTVVSAQVLSHHIGAEGAGVLVAVSAVNANNPLVVQPRNAEGHGLSANIRGIIQTSVYL